MAAKHRPKASKAPTSQLNPTVEDSSVEASTLVQASVQYVTRKPGKKLGETMAAPDQASADAVTNGLSVQDIVMSELQAARLLNVDMPDEPKLFIRLLEARIKEITGTQKNAILILDELSGTYTCLNDEVSDDFARAPRELTWISDSYLQELLGSERVIHSFLHHQGNIFGIVAIADKNDGSAFSLKDEIILEQLTQYLAVQVNHYLTLKKSMMLPTVQRILLQISNRLLSAVDSPSIFEQALSSIIDELPFSAGQFIQLDDKTGKGHVLYQMASGVFESDEPLSEVNQFASLLSLFQSQVWRHDYLYLKGEMLGDKSFSQIFGLPRVVSVLMLPMFSPDFRINGALVLFQQDEPVNLSKEAFHVVEQVGELVISACGRAQVLEKALEIATTDELTGAVNRRGFYTRFDAELDRARRNQSSMCLAMIDVDHFKIINDTYGHLTGDQVLEQMAELVQHNIRKSDLLCRFGGEEFALLLPEISLPAAMDLMERLRKKMARFKFQTVAGPLQVTFSAGITIVDTQSAADVSSIISNGLSAADGALYEAKQMGRNRVLQAE